MGTAVYVRISRDRDDQRGGVERQRGDCGGLCNRNGWKFKTYEDNDTSAYSGKRRPEWERLLDDVRAGHVDRIVAWHPDRMLRSNRELEDFIDLIEATGCAVVTVVAGEYDLTTVEGRLTARIVGSVARAESEHKSRRLQRKHLALAEAGEWQGGGKRCYGYERVDGAFTVVESEAEVIREIMGRYLAGEGISSIARDLNKRGLRPALAKEWSTTSVRRMLGSARLAGQREHKGSVVPAVWPAIVTPAEMIRARAMLAASTAACAPRAPARTHVLTGVIYCERCGYRLVSGRTRGGQRRYTCTGVVGRPSCGRMAIVAEPVESLIVEMVIQAIDTPKFAKQFARRVNRRDRDSGDALAVIRGADAQLAELADAYADERITMAEWVQARRRVEERAESARQRIADADQSALLPYVANPGVLRSEWPALDVAQQNVIIRTVLDRVVIGPATHIGRVPFEPERVTVTWRG